MENIDSRLLNREQENGAAKELKEKKTGSAGEEGGDETGAAGEPRSYRQRIQAARRAMNLKQKAKDKLEEKVAAPIGMLKTKLLNLIPGYGPYVVFKRFIAGKKSKFNFVDIMIMLFSNLTACFTILAVLALIAMIMGWIQHPLQAIADLSWGAISALVSLFNKLL